MNAERDFLNATFGELGDAPLYERALTHGSRARDSYERLEFLGDRVLGLAVARWSMNASRPRKKAR